ncbi:hypothetical protein CBL_11672 [Carabus blaptoides fortunei]
MLIMSHTINSYKVFNSSPVRLHHKSKFEKQCATFQFKVKTNKDFVTDIEHKRCIAFGYRVLIVPVRRMSAVVATRKWVTRVVVRAHGLGSHARAVHHPIAQQRRALETKVKIISRITYP